MVAASRISWIDYAKVLCIWLMVCCHAGQQGMVLQLAYQFHIPAFFIISGFLFMEKGIRKTLVSFLVPILFYGLLYLVFRLFLILYKHDFNWSLCSGDSLAVILGWIKSFVWCYEKIDVFPGSWFVFALLFLRLLMEVGWVRNIKCWIAAACFVWMCLEPLMGFSRWNDLKVWHVISSLPFFVTGMLLREKQVDVVSGSFEFKLFCAFAFFVLALIQGRTDLFEYRYGISYALFFLNAILGSYLLFNLCSCAPSGRRWIVTLSIGTLLILGLHFEMFPYLTVAFRVALSIDGPYLPMLVGLTVMALCYPLIILFARFCPLLLGKTK